MAGYMKKLNGHVYDGAHVAAVELPNGVFAEIDAQNKVALASAAKDMQMRVVEKTTLWTMPAVILDVIKEGTDEVYFVENEWEVYEDVSEYNTAEYTVPAGHAVKMHRPLVGEQLIMTVDEVLYAALTEGAMVKPTTDGTIAAV